MSSVVGDNLSDVRVYLSFFFSGFTFVSYSLLRAMGDRVQLLLLTASRTAPSLEYVTYSSVVPKHPLVLSCCLFVLLIRPFIALTTNKQHAPTSKATCKTCKTKIEKGSLKIVVVSQGMGDYTMERGFHSTCFKIPRKLVSDGVTPEVFIDEYLVDDSKDGDILSSQETREQLLHELEGASSKSKKSMSSVKTEGVGDEPTLMDRLKSAASNVKAPLNDNGDEEDETKPPAAKKVKTEETTSNNSKGKAKDPKDDFDDMLALYHKYSKMKADELKDYLRWNMQVRNSASSSSSSSSSSSCVLMRLLLRSYVFVCIFLCPWSRFLVLYDTIHFIDH